MGVPLTKTTGEPIWFPYEPCGIRLVAFIRPLVCEESPITRTRAGVKLSGMNRGWTVIELITVLVIMGILLSLGLPRLGRWRDRVSVVRAAGEASTFYQRARHRALVRAVPVRVSFYPDSLLAAMILNPVDSVFLVVPGPSRIGVKLEASRPTITLSPYGLGRGAANTTVILSRGAAAETLTTSRLGRIRRR